MIWPIHHAVPCSCVSYALQYSLPLYGNRDENLTVQPQRAARRDVARAHFRSCCHELLGELVPRPTIRVSGQSSQDLEADDSDLPQVRLDQDVFVTACAHPRDRGRAPRVGITYRLLANTGISTVPMYWRQLWDVSGPNTPNTNATNACLSPASIASSELGPNRLLSCCGDRRDEKLPRPW
jgi:hypothetical protein